MKLIFCGAARQVTGSCHMLEANGKRLLIDCGMKQGRDEVDDDRLPFAASSIDCLVITHAHIDHSGRLPLLVKEGFRGKVYTTRLTAELLEIMLRDSAHIQESDAAWENQKGKRAGKDPVEPLYTMEDAEAAIAMLDSVDYNQKIKIFPGLELMFTDAGHLLGSAYAHVWATEAGQTKKLVFSGDIGNKHQPIIRDPQKVADADFVIMESTYGDRDHEGEGGYTEGLAKILDETFAGGGNVIIPSFAVGRTQELLYFIREIKERGLVTSLPDFHVYVDSPLAKAATGIFAGDLTGYIDDDAVDLVKDGVSMFTFPNLKLCESVDESRLLNADKVPKVIISASGMCDAGRIRHHLKHNLWRKECAVVFVGFQAVGSFGRHLLDGASRVKLFGEEIAVRARLVNFKGLSGHADRTGLLEWINAYSPKPQHVFVVHGEEQVTEQFVQTLTEQGFAAHAPLYTEEYDLLQDCVTAPGITPPKKQPSLSKETDAFAKLFNVGRQLMEVIERNRGGTNKDLARFADNIRALIEKWNR